MHVCIRCALASTHRPTWVDSPTNGNNGGRPGWTDRASQSKHDCLRHVAWRKKREKSVLLLSCQHVREWWVLQLSAIRSRMPSARARARAFRFSLRPVRFFPQQQYCKLDNANAYISAAAGVHAGSCFRSTCSAGCGHLWHSYSVCLKSNKEIKNLKFNWKPSRLTWKAKSKDELLSVSRANVIPS